MNYIKLVFAKEIFFEVDHLHYTNLNESPDRLNLLNDEWAARVTEAGAPGPSGGS